MFTRALLLALFLCLSASAQEAGFRLERRTHQLGVWGGGSWYSPQWIGVTHGRKLVVAGARYGYVLAANDTLAFRVTSDLLPVFFVGEPAGQTLLNNPGTREWSWAWAAAPLGFQLNWRNGKKVQPFASISGGIAHFPKRQVPAPGSSHFNFTFDTGFGLEIFQSPRRAMTLGWRYHHISNAESGDFNPGIDSHVFYVGYSWYKRR